MTLVTGTRPRVLVVESDDTWRQRLRDYLGSALGTGEAATVEEAVGWLEGRAPGLTVLGVEGDDPMADEAVARIRELHPAEVVVMAAEEPTVDLCRRAMRVGAFDVVSRSACLGAGFERTLAEAARQLTSSQTQRRRRYDMVREAVARHERAETALLLEHHAVSGAWSKLHMTARRAWVRRYLNVAGADRAERAAFVREITEELAALDGPAALAIALHVQAVTTAHTGPAGEVPPGSRNLLIDLLAALVEQIQAGAGTTEPEETTAAMWHRWRVEDDEFWWLVVDGRLRAQVRVTPTGVDGHWLADAGDANLRSSALPALPEALREIERRVGCGYVLEVAPAEDR